MGKRKLNSTSFYQCDWTGYPMKAAHCYMPTWNAAGKLCKKGSYCNWEAVVAHAQQMLDAGDVDEAHTWQVKDHISLITGTAVKPAPHYTELTHCKGTLDVNEFHKACSKQDAPITVVKIAHDGEVQELALEPVDGEFQFDKAMLKNAVDPSIKPSFFHSTRKRSSNKYSDKDLGVFYYADKLLPHNPTASSLFKMQLYGDVLMVYQSREQAFIPRDRFVSFNKIQFDEQFAKRRRVKATDQGGLTPEDYATLKEKMTASATNFEQRASAKAVTPKDGAKGLYLARSDPKKLAAAARGRQVAGLP